jgi:hypothetical protein
VPLRQVKVMGKAFDASGKTGPAIAKVKCRDLTVVEAPSLQ